MAIEVVIFLGVVFGIACGLILERLRTDINDAEDKKVDAALPALSFGSKRLPGAARPDEVNRLRSVSDARFTVKKLLTDNEAIVLTEVEAIIADIGEAWRVLAQVSLSQVIVSSSPAAASAIEGQMAGMLVVGGDRAPIAVIEYQPLGQVRSEDVVRDAIKREALRRAGIGYIEVRASDAPGDLRQELAAIAVRRRMAAETEANFGPAEVVPLSAPVVVGPAADQAAVAKPARKPRGRPASGVKP